jgi:hypothetical protein
MGALDAKPLKFMRRMWAVLLCSKDKKMRAPLSTGIVQRITILFRPDEIELVSSLLTDECGPNLTKYPELQERIRFALLKLSHGDLNALRQAIDLAKLDWRDALVAAGFADDIKAHESWWPDHPMAPPT